MNLSELRSKSGGFTLVELLVGILLSGIVLAGLYSIFISQQRAFSAQERVAEMNQNIRAAMDLMTREIRLAGYKTSTATFTGIATAQASTIQVLADLNQDGDTADSNEDITYSYNAGTLQIWRNYYTLPIAENITSLSFTYRDANNNVTATLANIRKVTLSITARTAYPDPGTGLYGSITLTSDVTPRNLAF